MEKKNFLLLLAASCGHVIALDEILEKWKHKKGIVERTLSRHYDRISTATSLLLP